MDGYVTISTKLDTKDFDRQISEVEYELKQVEYELSKKKELKLDSRTIAEYESKAERLRNKIIDLRKRQQDLNNTDLRDVQKSIDNISDSTGKVIKKVSKWALAIFGVRSAYMFVRQSASKLAQYNEQIGADLEYISFALATMLQPVIETIISLVYKLLNYINIISQSLFGINLFANATQEAFNKTNKEAGKLKKTLAGFDEMNVVGDSAGGAGGGINPSDFLNNSNPEEVEKIKSFWSGIRKFWEEDFSVMINSITGLWANFIQGLGLIAQGLYYSLKGILDIVVGLFQIVVGLILDDTELIEKGWQKLCDGIKNLVIGLLEIIGGLLLTAFGFVKGLLGEFFGAIYNILIKPVVDLFKWLFDIIPDGFRSAMETSKSIFSSVVGFFRNIISTIIGLFKTIGIKTGEVIGSAFKVVINGVLGAIEKILNSPIRAINELLSVINKVPGINLSKLNTFNLPRLAVGGIVNMPSKGVPIGGAIAGESGAEGVIPLTNSQAMETLGQAIGKYINISATVPVYVGNKQIAREIKKINAESDFAFNR